MPGESNVSKRFIDLLMFIFIGIVVPLFHRPTHVTTVDTKSVSRGQSATLTCPIDITNCGELHSIKWFKGSERIGVASGDGKFSQVEGSFSDRYSILLYISASLHLQAFISRMKTLSAHLDLTSITRRGDTCDWESNRSSSTTRMYIHVKSHIWSRWKHATPQANIKRTWKSLSHPQRF